MRINNNTVKVKVGEEYEISSEITKEGKRLVLLVESFAPNFKTKFVEVCKCETIKVKILEKIIYRLHNKKRTAYRVQFLCMTNMSILDWQILRAVNYSQHKTVSFLFMNSINGKNKNDNTRNSS